MNTLNHFLSGANTMGFLVAALLFLRAWERTRDALFGSFAAAFVLLAANQLLAVFVHLPDADKSWIFLLRLAAFILIIVAIVTKNFRRRSGRA